MSTDGLEQSGSPPLTFEQRAHFYEEEVDLSRLATEARRRGDYHNALRAYFQLIPVQDRLYTTNSVQVARSFNAVGECTLALGRPDAAEESFDQALGVRETAEYGGMGLGERWDAVVSRDNMAKVREVQGKLLEARELRLRGKDSDMLCCSNSECPARTARTLAQLNQCGGCRCSFYCNTECQKLDWKRHKTACQQHGSRVKTQIEAL